MMNYLQAIILGIVQGATEFLPVSSSGHLVIFQRLLHLEGDYLAFDVAVHVATLLAIVVVYWGELQGMAQSAWRYVTRRGSSQNDPSARTDCRFITLIVIGTIPAGVVGFLFNDLIEEVFQNPRFAATTLAVTGLILFSTRWVKPPSRSKENLSVREALIVGIAQAIAILPGVSRAGSTMVSGLWAGLERPLAAEFSFMLALPAVAGAAVLELPKLFHDSGAALKLGPVAVGSLAAAVTGYLALRWLIKLVTRGKLVPFAYYCWVASLFAHYLISRV